MLQDLGIFNDVKAVLPAINGILETADGNLGLAGLVRIIPEVRVHGAVFKLGKLLLLAG
jgi:hypothetical protein